MQVVRYTIEWEEAWNNFIEDSKNGTFLLNRNYMDYHKDRFKDCSLIFSEGDTIMGVLPANWAEEEKTVYSHQGLTYGGLIMNPKCTSAHVMQMMNEAIDYCKNTLGAEKMIYRAVPIIYQKYPSQEDLYYIWQHGGTIKQRLLSSSILMKRPLKFHHSRTASINKAIRNELYVEKNLDPQDFWVVLEEVLQEHHSAKPVHTLQEMTTLMESFPREIQLFTVKKDKRVIAGTILYVTPQVVHTQYIASNNEGRNNGALDLLFKYLIQEKFKHITFFDFGTSNEDAGHSINTGLIAQKEHYGGRGVVYDTYEINMP
ncbi:MAG: GNAT family N-acetyltransferase [Prevotella sp.]|nr:GNAT family N-acetyltransferase [Candidatus Equicola stercoris]